MSLRVFLGITSRYSCTDAPQRNDGHRTRTVFVGSSMTWHEIWGLGRQREREAAQKPPKAACHRRIAPSASRALAAMAGRDGRRNVVSHRQARNAPADKTNDEQMLFGVWVAETENREPGVWGKRYPCANKDLTIRKRVTERTETGRREHVAGGAHGAAAARAAAACAGDGGAGRALRLRSLCGIMWRSKTRDERRE